MPDGQLWLLRDTYTAQTAWAPRHTGKELRLARLGAFDAALGAIRADAEAQAARKAGDHDHAERHDTLAASYRALRDLYQQREHTLAQAMADRQDWDHATAGSRHLAIAADAELRRRYPGHKIQPLRSAEPVTDTERRRHAIRDGHPDQRPCRTAPGIPPENQPATAPDDAPQGPGLGCPRRHPALLVDAAPGCDLAAP